MSAVPGVARRPLRAPGSAGRRRPCPIARCSLEFFAGTYALLLGLALLASPVPLPFVRLARLAGPEFEGVFATLVLAAGAVQVGALWVPRRALHRITAFAVMVLGLALTCFLLRSPFLRALALPVAALPGVEFYIHATLRGARWGSG